MREIIHEAFRTKIPAERMLREHCCSYDLFQIMGLGGRFDLAKEFLSKFKTSALILSVVSQMERS